MPTRVFPIPGTFAVGFPNTEHDVETKEEVKAHLATGAFALSAEEAEKQSPLTDPPKSKSKE